MTRRTWVRAVEGHGLAHALDRRGDSLCGRGLADRLDFHDTMPAIRVCGACARIAGAS